MLDDLYFDEVTDDLNIESWMMADNYFEFWNDKYNCNCNYTNDNENQEEDKFIESWMLSDDYFSTK